MPNPFHFHTKVFSQKPTMESPHLDYGPPRTPQDPLIVILAGAGDVASSYTALSPRVCRFARILIYDGSGLGRSESGPQRPTAISATSEVHSLLHVMKLYGPLVLVTHSYGAMVAREYLHWHAEQVVGMVLVNGSTERQFDYFQIPDPNVNTVLRDLELSQVSGPRAKWRARAIHYSRRAIPRDEAE
ncbi:hypothetical protein N7492_007002 [Penicillium capsulatum]|uniref:AB hydrolase-1 domain-containing protein n=1 Tax=Penicillium capsulatum TaxID=69766 RepID=A0A9W9I2U1_9EURO|nr:hypothetical protein N7492_007002 [Penicillium capsulatum]KAJ6116835.1 hypothetical protein N7512_006560 [Penicillium capsulatum]